ncbi:hypothetical protein CBR_g6501 [Chara braunii]|uniref:Uncharacterized protein n=1 Tax=Chara braunii TaxID=69332 RepID=A0A388KK84_CHABU|nr:hypothetical protein CBR_g6501 [Chara braunii]|eukprot:GBG70373.1 hypothetical protein CBR_g6501 [Chara braunii]
MYGGGCPSHGDSLKLGPFDEVEVVVPPSPGNSSSGATWTLPFFEGVEDLQNTIEELRSAAKDLASNERGVENGAILVTGDAVGLAPSPPRRAQSVLEGVIGKLDNAVGELNSALKDLLREQKEVESNVKASTSIGGGPAVEAPDPSSPVTIKGGVRKLQDNMGSPSHQGGVIEKLQDKMDKLNRAVTLLAKQQELENIERKAKRARTWNRRTEALEDLRLRLEPVVKTRPGHPTPNPDPCFARYFSSHLQGPPFAVGDAPPSSLLPQTMYEVSHIDSPDILDALHWFYNEDVLGKLEFDRAEHLKLFMSY